MSYNRDKYLQKKYGISLEQYDKMLENQKYRCGICGKHRQDSKLNFDVDHDHKTGAIRGLLCRYCNSYIMKHLRDNRIIAEGLAKYLNNWLERCVRNKEKI